jgi:hypothetical protein
MCNLLGPEVVPDADKDYISKDFLNLIIFVVSL